MKTMLMIMALINSSIATGQGLTMSPKAYILVYTTEQEGEIISAERNHQDSTGFYLIQFEYDSRFCTIPATYPAGQPHYSAQITVFKIVDGKKEMIGKPFMGKYTPHGCFEDDPAYLIEKANGLNKNILQDD